MGCVAQTEVKHKNNNTKMCYCQHIFVLFDNIYSGDVMKYCYQRIRDLREDHDKTQAQIANMLGVHTTQYRRWELGETEIPVHILIKLCKYYKVSADYILGL